MRQLILPLRQSICLCVPLEDYSNTLTFPIINGIIGLTIPAKPLNDAQIGGLLFYGGRG